MTTENQLPAENQTTIAGDVTSGGDFVARDKTIHGDAVGGDKVGGDKVGGDKIAPQGYVAIGGQIVHVHLQTAAVAMPTPDQEEPGAGDSPYQELNYFGFADAHRFFGREQLTAELAGYLRSHPFLAVVGASGSGKSSLVRAGLIPALHYGEPLVDGTLPPAGSPHWPIHIMQPKAHPLRELAATLLRDGDSDLEHIRLEDELAQDARILDRRATRLLSGGAAKRLLLVVDQFEELFTLCKDPSERKAFVDNLLTAAVADGVTTVVITLRADFYAHCFAFDNLRAALEGYQKNIGPMDQDELRRAIEEPARLGGWELEPGLVELLLADVGDEPGALPLLSHALLETWKRRRGRTLTLAGYAASGRVQGAIAHTAEAVFTQLATPQQQAIAKNIFLRLTELGEGAEDTRRRVQLAELMPKPAEKATIEAVLTTLADARLVTTDKDEVEVAHEALIRSWPTLRGWLDENREGIRLRHRLLEDAQRWAELEHDREALYSGRRLEQVAEWESTGAFALSTLEQTFLEASEARATRERQQRTWIRLGIAVVILSVFVGMAVLSWQQLDQRRAKRAWDAAIAAKAQCDVDVARQSFDTAVRQNAEYSQLRDDEVPNMIIDCATRWVQTGERTLREAQQSGDKAIQQTAYLSATTLFADAAALNPPPDIPIYVKIPAGEFIMGAGEGDNQIATEFRWDNRNEQPTHTVYLDEFWIQRTEVTNEQYLRYVDENCGQGADDKECPAAPSNTYYNKPAWSKRPVTDVDWFQATDYAAWVGGRLPTEAEWEKACRGGLEIPVDLLDVQSAVTENPLPNRLYPWGNEAPTDERLNYNYAIGTVIEVGSYPDGTGPYGLYDMAGNVWEWTADWYNETYYTDSPDRNPTGPEDDGTTRTLRGGSWSNVEFDVRCAVRHDLFVPDLDYVNVGFRVVRHETAREN
ncbi:MAG: SUMF1/EgtB/PvdO family nonheme iron enzyme [Caldilineaceae bacterium]